MVAGPADNVTESPSSAADALLNARPSLLPFDPKDMMAIRVRPAGFAAMCGVTRQSVSQWIKKGWVSLGPDGLLDPVVATRQLLSHADPARLRARIFREATATLGELRARIQSLEAEVAAAKPSMADMTPNAELAGRLDTLIEAILGRFELDGAAFGELVELACVHVLDLPPAANDSRETRTSLMME